MVRFVLNDSLQYLLYYNLRPQSRQVNGQGSFKVKENGQTFLVDVQSFAINALHENIPKINGIRSKVQMKFWQKSKGKPENRSRPTLSAVADCCS